MFPSRKSHQVGCNVVNVFIVYFGKRAMGSKGSWTMTWAYRGAAERQQAAIVVLQGDDEIVHMDQNSASPGHSWFGDSYRCGR